MDSNSSDPRGSPAALVAHLLDKKRLFEALPVSFWFVSLRFLAQTSHLSQPCAASVSGAAPSGFPSLLFQIRGGRNPFFEIIAALCQLVRGHPLGKWARAAGWAPGAVGSLINEQSLLVPFHIF